MKKNIVQSFESLQLYKMETCLASLSTYPDVSGHPLVSNGTSWVIVARNFFPADETAFEDTWSQRPTDQPVGFIMGRSVQFPRRTRAYGQDYSFTGQTTVSDTLQTLPKLCREYRKCIMNVIAGLNGVL